MYDAVVIGCRFYRTATGRPNANNAAARLFCLIDLIRCFLRNTIKFRMHMMLFHIINLDRAECSQSDMQCHARDRYTHLFDLLQ